MTDQIPTSPSALPVCPLHPDTEPSPGEIETQVVFSLDNFSRLVCSLFFIPPNIRWKHYCKTCSCQLNVTFVFLICLSVRC